MLAHKVIVDIEVQFYLRQIKSVLNLNTKSQNTLTNKVAFWLKS